ncbi:uncharacterized protein MONOS_2982 [Monocercomonoides exilis]|uniref:uncharacterized protein n=1 Tax=Monocercomonoides exilis TaxID=2049356 RepID=UPI00355AB4D1|nr:hypothetical protein MONOS_2982 [Monocercomonoides exilis]|eukprot:MONOS_2982.1-p1 / transcript=MONOS_2982.1 / gene=MONOS_2982 / organism=Monocercomonoides_exilis_PA203 / gene_product=unspecified product / transcript_product=unspecified product / location=Mono_scaffold00066:22359-32621(+) / protein_length=3268 / sequence_SO=supercontig / SO=protein_coding / is_pseudo=false
MKQQILQENENYIFKECKWHSCTALTGNERKTASSSGAAIFINGQPSASVNIESCIFAKCETITDGGAILSCKSQSFEAGGICVYYTSECLSMSCIKFENCSCQTYGGGVMMQQDASISNSWNSGNGKDVYLENCDACSTDSPFVESFTLTEGGNHLYLSNHGWNKQNWLPYGILRRYVLEENGTDSMMCGLTIKEGCQTLQRALSSDFGDFGKQEIIIIGNYSLFEAKGVNVNSLNATITGVKEEGMQTQLTKAGIVEGCSMFTVTSCTLEVTDVEIVHCSNGSGRTFVTGDDKGVIMLKRVHIGFLAESVQTAIEESPFCAAFGQILFFECCIAGLQLNRVALFEGATNVLLEDTEISNIIRKEGNGAIFDPTIGEGELWELNNISLKNCQCENGNGGAVYVRVEKSGMMRMGNVQNVKMRECKVSIEEEAKRKGGGIFIDVSDDQSGFELKNVFFEGCEAWTGKKIFLRSANLKRIVNEANIGWIMNDEEERKLDELNGFEGDTTGEEYVIPLVVYLWNNISETVHINGIGGFDFSGCGYEEAPCASIDWAIGIWCNPSPSNEWKFLMETEVAIKNAICFRVSSTETAYRIIGKQELTSISVENAIGVDQQTSIIYSNIVLAFENTFFQLPNVMKEGINQLFWSSSNLELTNCMFELIEGTTIGYSLIEIEGGSLEGKCVIFGSELFETVVETGYNLISVSGRMKLEEWNFFGCVQKDGNGSCIDLKRVSQIDGASMKNCSFCDCESRGVNRVGGAIATSVEGDGWLTLENCTFLECKVGQGVEYNKGLGGGFYVECDGGRSGISLADLQFQDCKAWKGKNIFVCGESLSRIVIREHFAFDFKLDVSDIPDLEEMNGYENEDQSCALPLVVFLREFVPPYYVGNDGNDVKGCGFKDFSCQTIKHVISLCDGIGLSQIRLLPQFCIRNRLVFWENAIQMDVEEKNTTILFGYEGELNGNGIIEMQSKVTIKGIRISVDSIVNEEISCLLHCSGSKAHLNECSLECVNGVMKISFIWITNGEMIIENLQIESLKLSCGEGLIYSKGNRATCVMEQCTLRLLEGNISFGMLLSASGSTFELRNVEIENVKVVDCGMICSNENSSLSMHNVTIENENRFKGSGGTVVGIVGEGKTFEMENNTLRSCKCMESGQMRGGGIFVEMKKGGIFHWDKGTVHDCFVDEASGLGGGMFLKLSDVSLEYWIRNAEYAENKAHIGKDVYLVCLSPSFMVNEECWKGSVNEEDELNSKWVYDDSVSPVISNSLILFIYPPSTAVVYVMSGIKSENDCGYAHLPCSSLIEGYSKMKNNQTTIHLNNSNNLDGEIDRNGIGLTVRGHTEENKSKLEIGIQGHFRIARGISTTELVLSRLIIDLPHKSEKHELIYSCVGRVSVEQCEVCAGEVNSNTDLLLCRFEGSEGVFASVALNGINFNGDSGIASVTGGKLTLRNVTVGEIEMEGRGLIIGRDGFEVVLRNCSCNGCLTKKGQVLNLENAKIVDIKERCTFRGCKNEEGNGGALSCSISSDEQVEVEETEMEECYVNEDTGKGGGMYLYMFDDSKNYVSMENPTFRENKAFSGKDMFIECRNLNDTVNKNRFVIKIFDENGFLITDMKGKDRTNFKNDDVELTLFLIKGQFESVLVSESGLDVYGCGKREHPCETFRKGYENIDESVSEKEMIISGKISVTNEFCVNQFVIVSFNEEEAGIIEVNEGIEGEDQDCIFQNDNVLQLENIVINFPSKLNDPHKIVFKSTGNELKMKKCKFHSLTNEIKEFSVVENLGGVLHLVECEIRTGMYLSAPLKGKSSTVLETCTFEHVLSQQNKQGGIMEAFIKEEEIIFVNDTTMEECECNENEGRGGGLFLSCVEARSEKPFIFEGVRFRNNKAWKGKNIFVLCSNLNKTVNAETFVFGDEGFEDDESLYCGTDAFHTDTDLLRFLVTYSSSIVHISSRGFDVKRCGSKKDPCQTFIEGMKHFNAEEINKKMTIEGCIPFRNGFDLSGFCISSGQKDEEDEGYGEITFLKETEQEDDPEMINKGELSLTWLKLWGSESLGSKQRGLIANENGKTHLERCRIGWTGLTEATMDCSIAWIVKGELSVECTVIEKINVRNNLFYIADGCKVHVKEVEIESVKIVSGSIFRIVPFKYQNNGEKTEMEINGSQFLNVVRESNGACTFSPSSCNHIELSIEATTFMLCQSAESEIGGMGYFELCEEGFLQMKGGFVNQCECSRTKGKGGGIYLRSFETGKLDFVFDRCKFTENSGWKGRDIFVECEDIERQINELQFQMDLNEEKYNRINAIFGIDNTKYIDEPVDLIGFITYFQENMIIVSSSEGKGGSDERQCGIINFPCRSVEYGLGHLYGDIFLMLIVDEASIIEKEIRLEEMILRGRTQTKARIDIDESMSSELEWVIDVVGNVVVEGISFFVSVTENKSHQFVFGVQNGSLKIVFCSFGNNIITSCFGNEKSLEYRIPGILKAMKSIIAIEKGDLKEMEVDKLIDCEECELDISQLKISSVKINGKGFKLIDTRTYINELICVNLYSTMSLFSTNCPSESTRDTSGKEKGIILSLVNCEEGCFDNCIFAGGILNEIGKDLNNNCEKELCKWNGSLVDLKNSKIEMKDTIICNSSKGGMSVSGGYVMIEAGNFSNNSPSIENYPSVRRNIICSDSASLTISSLKGGDGFEKNTSLWFLNEGCLFEGIASERASSFFIPSLERVETKEAGAEVKLMFKGKLLLPCNLLFMVVKQIGDEKQIEKYGFDGNGYVSETEAEGSVPSKTMAEAGDEAEVRVCVLFGSSNEQSFTDSFILKNRTEPEKNGDGNVVQGGKGSNSFWVIIVVACAVFIVLLAVIVVLVVRWRKVKERNEELQEIVNDNIRKDPKAFEMVTMEMSPEEQWRRAEKEAEKKNEERIKKRVYEKSLGHSESSEHLLSESGSTEYILGRDSDKIPEWALEKVEEEEIRKRTPSPSISSTSTTDTSDTESTFVRSESLCPTTSSMSNLVDAMACSCPYEKLIVDLRDSLFMLLHGKNEKKEMAIGSLKEREQTAAQVLFWVANLALHSFDEMENPLQSLANLSPHIVLFSEHMVICIVMHSDFSSDGDSDSSSISSSTVVTSASGDDDDDDEDSLPSSAFEDEDDFKKECLRWKAPELLINKKMGATKESVSFSIGMMLWECLTLKIPFWEFEAEVAGQKIVNGERPKVECIRELPIGAISERCMLEESGSRPTLVELKREFIQRFPSGTAMVTISDAIDITGETEDENEESGTMTEESSFVSRVR